jgi:hypothetical protein
VREPLGRFCEGTDTPGTSHQARLNLEREEYSRAARWVVAASSIRQSNGPTAGVDGD